MNAYVIALHKKQLTPPLFSVSSSYGQRARKNQLLLSAIQLTIFQ